jgi:hypothetical protein
VKGPPPQWSRRDCRFDHLVAAAIAQGMGRELVYNGIESYERADEIRRGVYRCAKHRKVSVAAGPSGRTVTGDEMGIHKDGKTYSLHYKVVDKKAARKAHIEKYGADRSQWPYDPRRRATPEERASWAKHDELGNVVDHE